MLIYSFFDSESDQASNHANLGYFISKERLKKSITYLFYSIFILCAYFGYINQELLFGFICLIVFPIIVCWLIFKENDINNTNDNDVKLTINTNV